MLFHTQPAVPLVKEERKKIQNLILVQLEGLSRVDTDEKLPT